MDEQPEQLFGYRKAELHAHLNGCIPPSLVAELLHPDEVVAATTILEPVGSMQEYFEPWTVFRNLATSPEATERIIQVAAGYLSADGVVYAELRNTVRHLANLNDIPLEEATEWLCAGMEEASVRTGVDLRLIVSLTREHFSLEASERLLLAIASVAHPRLVGIDLTGDEGIDCPPLSVENLPPRQGRVRSWCHYSRRRERTVFEHYVGNCGVPCRPYRPRFGGGS